MMQQSIEKLTSELLTMNPEMSVGMMIFPVEAFVDDLLLASIFGGVVGGICL